MRQFSASLLFAILNITCLLGFAFVAPLDALETEPENPVHWVETPPLPVAMQEIYPAVFKERIIVGGGFTPSSSPTFYGLAPTDQVFILTPARKRWRNAPALPEARHHLGLISNRHYIYGIGGFSGSKDNAWQIQRSVFRLDGNLQRWRNGPSLPFPLAESVYASIGKNIHVIGGKTLATDVGKNIDSDAHYVLVNNAYWRKAKKASIARNSAASAVIANKVFVFGGRKSGANAINLDLVEVYDAETDSWTALSPMPVAAAGLSASVLDG